MLVYGVDGWVESKKGLTTRLFFRVYYINRVRPPTKKAEVAGCIIDLSGADKQQQMLLIVEIE